MKKYLLLSLSILLLLPGCRRSSRLSTPSPNEVTYGASDDVTIKGYELDGIWKFPCERMTAEFPETANSVYRFIDTETNNVVYIFPSKTGTSIATAPFRKDAPLYLRMNGSPVVPIDSTKSGNLNVSGDTLHIVLNK